ncbi:MAG: hypothetical protein IJ878_10045, partial [Exiguobacterium sp.]|nr:hypothetical protein [Exiguobacterium sp.]
KGSATRLNLFECFKLLKECMGERDTCFLLFVRIPVKFNLERLSMSMITWIVQPKPRLQTEDVVLFVQSMLALTLIIAQD